MLDFSTNSKINAGKIGIFLYTSFAAIMLWLIFINSPEDRFISGYFASLHTISAVIIIADVLFDFLAKDKNFLDVYTWDDRTTFGDIDDKTRKYLLIGAVVLFVLTFLAIGSRPTYSILAPQFQILDFNFLKVELGTFSKHLVTVLAATAESILFFGVLLGTLRKSFSRLTGENELLGALIALIIAPLIFTFSHAYVFAGQSVEFFNTYVYGLFTSAFVLITHTILFEYALHTGNNLGIQVFREQTLYELLLNIINSRIFLLSMIAAGFLGLLVYLSRRNK